MYNSQSCRLEVILFDFTETSLDLDDLSVVYNM